MKCKFKDEIITLTGETKEEKEFLYKAFKEGLRNYGGGSNNSLALPSLAGLTQVHLDQDDVNALKRINNMFKK